MQFALFCSSSAQRGMKAILLLVFVSCVTAIKENDDFIAKSRTSRSDLDKSVFEMTPEGNPGQTSSQSEAIQTERPEQVAKSDGTRAKRQVLKDVGNRSLIWANGVYYMFETIDQIIQNAFKMGVKVWTDNTCIDFTEDRNARDKVVVRKSTECSSNVGRVGGNQFLCLADSTEGSAVHEIGHVLGLFHTMARYDRDHFITIVAANVKPGSMRNFKTVSWEHAEVYGLTYDYGSIMHYNEKSFSGNNQPTMIATQPYYQKTMGSPIISFSDIFMINKRYGCNALCDKATSAKCMNEGFPHPRNCSICICPSGYGGALCDRRPPGCGEDLDATSEKKTLTYRLGYGLGRRDLFDFCNFMIRAPGGKKIEVDLQSISLGYDNSGCQLGGVEIKAQRDQKLTGYRFCSVSGSGGPIVSSYNVLPVILYNRFTYMDVVLTYRYIG